MPSITGTLSSSGDSAALIAAPTSPAFIEVWSLSLMAKDSDITVTVKSGSTVKFTALTPASGVGGIAVPAGREPIFQCAAAEALKINLSGAGNVAYNINYAIK